MRYQCNVCAKIFDSFNDAALCHPDVNVINDSSTKTGNDCGCVDSFPRWKESSGWYCGLCFKQIK